MMKVIQTTKIILAWELFEQGLPKTHVADRLQVNRDTIRLWIQSIAKVGMVAFLDSYSNAKKGPRPKRQVDAILKRRVWMLRDREMECCGQKIQYFLNLEYGMKISVPKIYEILAEKYVIKSKWKKNQKRGPVPVAEKAREVIQMDTVHFGMVFAFTAVDTFAKDISVKLYPTLTSNDGKDFLAHLTIDFITQNCCKQMVDRSLRESSSRTSLPMQTGFELPGHTRKMNNHT